jgi:hypothetical protein
MLNRLRTVTSLEELYLAMALDSNDETGAPGAMQVVDILFAYGELGGLAVLFLDCVQIYSNDLWALYVSCRQSGHALLQLLCEKMTLSDQGVTYDELRQQLLSIIGSPPK